VLAVCAAGFGSKWNRTHTSILVHVFKVWIHFPATLYGIFENKAFVRGVFLISAHVGHNFGGSQGAPRSAMCSP
jgi:hypothetical protein